MSTWIMFSGERRSLHVAEDIEDVAATLREGAEPLCRFTLKVEDLNSPVYVNPAQVAYLREPKPTP